jgi:hypothetical protein
VNWVTSCIITTKASRNRTGMYLFSRSIRIP